MPLTTDIDDDVVAISLITTSCIYPVAVASGIITMSPATSDFGTCSVTLNLFDGFNYVQNAMSVTVTPN